MGLRVKFNLVMLAALLVGLGVAAYFAKDAAEETARAGVRQEATLLMQQAIAVRGYTAGEITPLLAEQSAARFLPHTIPSFAAQTVLRGMQRDFPEYAYKEAALNATNPADRATDWEADIINAFRRDAAQRDYVGERETPHGPVLTYARPIRIADPGCLTCHSTPAAAPASMVELYGTANGFGWNLNEVIGAQLVTVPMSVALTRARDQLGDLLTGLGITFVGMLLLLNLLLHYAVILPVQRMTASAERAAAGELEGPELPAGRDELGSLARSFNLMRRSLVKAMRMLEA
ncbi:DUF3365 domain-containing protein [Roseomonas sp. CCTCC AB2023176]|uniref:c-type heme family protein n=1 Tax=Roseomonas sp. CCTCC AB2023176 TaxID=3342640 RepID=UPI0035E2CC63